MKYSIRFLKQGLIEFESDTILTSETAMTVAQEYLSTVPDHLIIEAMSDFSPKESKLLGTRFDMDDLEVQCVESTNDTHEYTNIFATPLWNECAYEALSHRIEQLEYQLYQAQNK